MVVRKRGGGYEYDFRLLGDRHRKGRFRTKAEATAAEKLKREELLSGKRKVTFAEAYEKYLSGTTLAVTTREGYQTFYDRNIRAHIGHLYIEAVTTEEIDKIKAALPERLGPKSINQRLILVRAVLRFAWRRGWLAAPPWVPMEEVPKKDPDWYTVDERDALLEGMFELYPHWYLFFYLTARLGLRAGEIYAIEHRQFQPKKSALVIDQAVERGSKDRAAIVGLRKGNDTLTLEVTSDLFDVYEWHCRMGFAGKRYVFLPTDKIPKFINSHKPPLRKVQKAKGLRELSHHVVGRHSVASQALTVDAHMKAVQQQLGHKSEQSTHKYAHVKKDAQRKIVEMLRPVRPAHENDLN